jgi:hypothetical protein
MRGVQPGGNVVTLKVISRFCDKNVIYPAKIDTKLSDIFLKNPAGKRQ